MKMTNFTIRNTFLLLIFTFLSVWMFASQADLKSIVKQCQRTQHGKQCAVKINMIDGSGETNQYRFVFKAQKKSTAFANVARLVGECNRQGLSNITGCWVTLNRPKQPTGKLEHEKPALSIAKIYKDSKGMIKAKIVQINVLSGLGQSLSDKFPCKKAWQREENSKYPPCVNETKIGAEDVVVAWNGVPQGKCQLVNGKLKGACKWGGKSARVLDPLKGKIYHGYLQLKQGGCQLKLRGFIGFSFIGRNEYWTRFSPTCINSN